MQIGGNSKRVKLIKDLTKYNSNLTIGQTGKTVPDVSFSSFGNMDDFVAVEFDCGTKMDIATYSLEFV